MKPMYLWQAVISPPVEVGVAGLGSKAVEQLNQQVGKCRLQNYNGKLLSYQPEYSDGTGLKAACTGW